MWTVPNRRRSSNIWYHFVKLNQKRKMPVLSADNFLFFEIC
ncbi:hypothetical protein X975_00371, partial [Stegodyphus mimosarum]